MIILFIGLVVIFHAYLYFSINKNNEQMLKESKNVYYGNSYLITTIIIAVLMSVILCVICSG